ncbi:MAG: hypothetical protein ABSC15_08490 [Terriglobales bacterium]|jgi:hypothetical protein
MRTALLAFAFLTSIVHPSAQQPSTVATISRVLQNMKSHGWTERSHAFEKASELLASGKLNPSDSDRLKLGIIQLLIAENVRANVPDDEALKQSTRTGSGKHEDEAEGEEYYPSLIGFVADMNDERAIPALVGAMPYASDATGALLRFGDKAVGPILDQLKSRNALLRTSALSTAITMEGQNEAVSRPRIRQMLRSALTDPVAVVRSSAVNEIACLDDRQDFVPMLEQLAKTDPVHYKGHADDGVDEDQFYPVRFDARRALREIRNNEPCLWRH